MYFMVEIKKLIIIVQVGGISCITNKLKDGIEVPLADQSHDHITPRGVSVFFLLTRITESVPSF